jgi:murein DD-endopeptidase MepM/ murein hydrolase activator NlpD
MDSFTVKKGDEVFKGQLIGYSGDRKRMDPHLHFEIRKNWVPKDPEIFLRSMPRNEIRQPNDVYTRMR